MKNNLKQIRTIKKISQKKLSDTLGVSKAMISMWENNPNEKIPEIRIKQICDYFNIDEDKLFQVDLDTRLLEKEAIKQEIEMLAEQYEKNYDSLIEKRIQEQLEMDYLHSELMDELNVIVNDSAKLHQMKRFSQIINDYEFETLLDKEVGLNGTENLVNGFIFLLTSKDIERLTFLSSVIEYLTLFSETGSIDKNSLEYAVSSNKEQLLGIEKLFNQMKFKRYEGKNKE